MEEENKINDYEVDKQIARTMTMVRERLKQVVDNSKKYTYTNSYIL
jgi:hypothetical protein